MGALDVDGLILLAFLATEALVVVVSFLAIVKITGVGKIAKQSWAYNAFLQLKNYEVSKKCIQTLAFFEFRPKVSFGSHAMQWPLSDCYFVRCIHIFAVRANPTTFCLAGGVNS